MSASIASPPPASNRDEVLSRALDWLCAAPVRVEEAASPAFGATLHGLDSRTAKSLGVYTEITGYAISLYLFLWRCMKDQRFLRAASEAAGYLLKIQTQAGAYPHLPDPAVPSLPERQFSFDTAACIVGMARLARVDPDRRYLQSAMEACSWLLGMQRTDGSFSSMLLADVGIRNPGGFYGDGSCIHAKNAIALLEVHAAGGRDELRRAALQACNHTLSLQAPDGAFWSTPERREVFTHAHCYACEGLLYAGSVLGEERFLAAARKGVAWLVRSQSGDGGWLSSYKVSGVSRRRVVVDALRRPEPTDAAAQAIRLFHLTGQARGSSHDAAVRFLIQCQHAGGGFFYHRTRFGLSPLLYTWCAQFAVQALAWNAFSAKVEDLF